MHDQDTDLRAACLDAGLCDEAALDAAAALRESLAAAGETVDLLGALGRNGVLDDEKLALLRQAVPGPSAAPAAPADAAVAQEAAAAVGFAPAPREGSTFGQPRPFGGPAPTGAEADESRGRPPSHPTAAPGHKTFGGRDTMFESGGGPAATPGRRAFGSPAGPAGPPAPSAPLTTPAAPSIPAPSASAPSAPPAPSAQPPLPAAPPPRLDSMPPATPARPAFGSAPPAAPAPAAPPAAPVPLAAPSPRSAPPPTAPTAPPPLAARSVPAAPAVPAASARPAPRDLERATRPAKVRTRGGGLKVVVVLLLLLLLAGGGAAGWWFFLRPQEVTGPSPEQIAAAEKAAAVAEARVALDAADAFAADNPLELEAVLLRFEEVARAHPALPPADLGTSRARANTAYEDARESAFAVVHEAARRADALGEPVEAVLSILEFPESMRHGDLAKQWAERYAYYVGQVVKTGMVFVPAGPVRIGTGSDRVVDVPHFLIDRTEVSNSQYADFVTRTGAAAPSHWGDDKPPAHLRDLPVVGITHAQATTYAEWRKKRLPTAEEWEKAARSTEGWNYPWGNAFDPVKCISRESERAVLSSTSSFAGGASLYGALHMAGNAAEWTADAAPPVGAVERRVVRGGSARSDREGVRVTAAEEVDETNADPERLIGFRCAQSVESSR